MIVLRNLLEITSLFFISLIIFAWGLNANEVIGFESRFYLFALEMWRDGLSWFPTTYQQPYPDYPATSTFLIYIFAKLFGGMNKLIAVLPSAIAASITVTITYLIGSLQQKRWGMFAVLFLFCTFTFLKTARSIELDMYSAMITTACFYVIYSADLYHKYYRVYWIYPLLLIGFAFRGPIGLILPAGVICSFYFLECQFKKLFLIGLFALLLLLACTTTLLFLAYLTDGNTFMHQVLHMQVLGRINNEFLPVYFYFTNSIKNYALSFPLAVLVMLGIIGLKAKKSSEIQLLLKLFAWIFVILLGMSIPGDKKIRYILPIVPAAALLAAYFFVAPKNNYFMLMRYLILRLFLYLPIIFLFIIGYLWYFQHQTIAYFIGVRCIIFLISVQLCNFFIYIFYARRTELRELIIVLIAAFLFVMTYINVIEPIEMHVEQAQNFVSQIELTRLQQQAKLVFYKEKPDGLPIKYLINTQTAHPIFIDNQAQLNQFKQRAFFITSAAYFAELAGSSKKNFNVIAQGKIGHIAVVVFTQREHANE